MCATSWVFMRFHDIQLSGSHSTYGGQLSALVKCIVQFGRSSIWDICNNFIHHFCENCRWEGHTFLTIVDDITFTRVPYNLECKELLGKICATWHSTSFSVMLIYLNTMQRNGVGSCRGMPGYSRPRNGAKVSGQLHSARPTVTREGLSRQPLDALRMRLSEP